MATPDTDSTRFMLDDKLGEVVLRVRDELTALCDGRPVKVLLIVEQKISDDPSMNAISEIMATVGKNGTHQMLKGALANVEAAMERMQGGGHVNH